MILLADKVLMYMCLFDIILYTAICPSGEEYFISECVECDWGFYKEEEGPEMCESCPPGKLTETKGADDEDQCSAGLIPSLLLSITTSYNKLLINRDDNNMCSFCSTVMIYSV